MCGLFVSHHLLLLPLQLLLWQLLLGWLVIGNLGDHFFFLRKNDLNVAWGRHVRVDTTVGTVCTTTQAWSAVDLEILQMGYAVSIGVVRGTIWFDSWLLKFFWNLTTFSLTYQWKFIIERVKKYMKDQAITFLRFFSMN